MAASSVGKGPVSVGPPAEDRIGWPRQARREHMAKLRVGVLVFPEVQQLDLTGPFEVFASLPEAEVRLVWKRLEPLVSATGLVLTPDLTFAACPPLDVLCVPGGVGVNPLLEDEEVLGFLRHQAEGARYVTSVCTGGGRGAGARARPGQPRRTRGDRGSARGAPGGDRGSLSREGGRYRLDCLKTGVFRRRQGVGLHAEHRSARGRRQY